MYFTFFAQDYGGVVRKSGTVSSTNIEPKEFAPFALTYDVAVLLGIVVEQRVRRK